MTELKPAFLVLLLSHGFSKKLAGLVWKPNGNTFRLNNPLTGKVSAVHW